MSSGTTREHDRVSGVSFDATRDANILPRLVSGLEKTGRASRTRADTRHARCGHAVSHPRRRAPLHRRPRRRVPEENIVTVNSAFGRRAFGASSNDAACSSSTFARARDRSRVRTRREKAITSHRGIVRGVALATVTNAKKASSQSRKQGNVSKRSRWNDTSLTRRRTFPSRSRRRRRGTISCNRPRRIWIFRARRIGRNRSHATPLRSSILRARRRRRRPRRSPRFKISTRSTARPSFRTARTTAFRGTPRWKPRVRLRSRRRRTRRRRPRDGDDLDDFDPRRPTFERRAKRDGAKEDTPRTSSSDTPRTSSSDGDSVRARVLRRSTLRARFRDSRATIARGGKRRFPSPLNTAERFRSEPPRPAATTVIAGGAGALDLRLAVSIAETSPDARLCLLGRVGRSRRAAFPTSNEEASSRSSGDATTSEDAAAANDAIRRRSNRRDSSPFFPSPGVANLTLAGGVLADASLARQRAGSVRRRRARKDESRRVDRRRCSRPRARTRRSRASPSRPSPRCSGPRDNGYAAANAAMDADAVARRREGVDAVSAQFGAWTGRAWRRAIPTYSRGSNARASARSRPNRDSPRSPRSSVARHRPSSP